MIDSHFTFGVPMLAAFGIWDWGVVGIYFALITAIGLALARRNPDDKEYFLGGRSLPTWTVAVSIVATSLSAATFVGVPDQVFDGDISYLILNIGGFIAVFVVAFLFVPRLYRAGTITIYGFLADRFGEPARLAVSCAFIIGRMLASGARLFVAAIPLCLLMFNETTPSTFHLIIAICIIAAVGTFYTTMGGVRAVMWVDAVQLFIVIGTALLTIGLLLHHIPLSVGEIWDVLWHSTNTSTGLSKLTLVDATPTLSRPNTLWAALTGVALLNIATLGVDQDLAQRFLVSKSVMKGGISVIASQFISVIVVSLFMAIGLLLYIFYKRPDVMGFSPDKPPEKTAVYAWFLLKELPPILSGISIAGFFAVAQGSLDSAMSALASSIVADVYIPLRKSLGRPVKEHAAASRLTVASVGACLSAFAILCAIIYDPKTNTLLNFALGVMTFALTGMLGVFLTALLTKRGNSASVIAALVVGAVTVTLFQDAIIKWWSPALLGKPTTIAWPWWMMAGTTLSFCVCVSGRPRVVASASPVIVSEAKGMADALGIDIGGTSVKVAVWERGRWVHKGQSELYEQPTLTQLRDGIRAAVGSGRSFERVGVCVPGIFDGRTRSLTHCVNISALVGMPLDAFLVSALDLRVAIAPVVYSDALAAARDVYDSRRLGGRLFALSLGTGVGCGVLDGAQALDVDRGSPGHFGQVDVSIAGHEVIGPDGGAGGLEGYIGVAALRRAYGGSVRDILPRLTADDPPIRALVRALRIAHAIYRPQHICLCGGVGIGLARLVPAIRAGVELDLTRIARAGWTLSCGDDLFHAARGAARMAALK